MTRIRKPRTVCFPFAGGIVGGSHISACRLIRSLDRSAYEPLVVVHRRGGQVDQLLADEGISFESAPSLAHFGRAPGLHDGQSVVDLAAAVVGQARLANFLRNRRVAIVHTNEGAMHATWSVPARLAHAKLLWHHRSSPEARGLRYLAPLFADEVVAVSEFALSEHRARRGTQGSRIVYSPFDTELEIDRVAVRGVLLAELNIPADSQIVGYFGNLVTRKRPLLFVDIISEMRRRDPSRPIVGVMFGEVLDDGLDVAVMQRAAALGVADAVHLMGFRYPGAEWIAACDVLAVTAVGEPFGRTLIEAMLVGTPVVAAGVGGNSEAIRDDVTGLLAIVDDPASLADGVAALLDDPERRGRIVAAARTHARDRFGEDRHRQEIEAVYRDLLPVAGAGAAG